MTDLLNCPFCGGNASTFEDYDSSAWEASCFNGDCRVEPHVWEKTKAEAIAAWNDRTPDPAVQALAEAAREVYRISERDHVAWRKLSEALAAFDKTD